MSCGSCEKLGQSEEIPRNFCLQPSDEYLRLLEEVGGDPKVLEGLMALKGLRKTGGWVAAFDARDART